jgi:hypothetical protein
MTATTDFIGGALAFMQANAVIVRKGGVAIGGNVGDFRFTAEPALTGRMAGTMAACAVYGLDLSADPDVVSAYWCPYANDHTYSITVAGAANFMFTATMDGCSFGVGIEAVDGAVRVAHANVSENVLLEAVQEELINAVIGGNANAARLLELKKFILKNQLQRTELVGALGTDRFTGMGASDYAKMGVKCTTFGIRGGGGHWSFYAQAYAVNASIVTHYGCLPFGNQ